MQERGSPSESEIIQHFPTPCVFYTCSHFYVTTHLVMRALVLVATQRQFTDAGGEINRVENTAGKEHDFFGF